MNVAWYGFAVSTTAISPPVEYWATARTERGYRTELAGYRAVDDWESVADEWFELPDATAVTIADPVRGSFRIALSERNQIAAVLFISQKPMSLTRDYLATRPETAPHQILSGRAPLSSEDVGSTVCSCFSVGLNFIIRAIQTKRLVSVEELGQQLQAGTNCGSCRPELAELIKKYPGQEARKSAKSTRVCCYYGL